LDDEFLQVRATLVDLAAALDRIDRADESGQLGRDTRYERIRQALEVLNSKEPGRAERVLLLFSDPYEPDWRQKLGC